MNISKFLVDERWYIKVPNKPELLCGEIVEITENTVLIRNPYNWMIENRYRMCDIIFVEKIKE